MRQMEKGEKETGGSNGETRERRRIEAGTQEDWIVGSRQSVLAECRSQSRTSCRLNHVIQQAACWGGNGGPPTYRKELQQLQRKTIHHYSIKVIWALLMMMFIYDKYDSGGAWFSASYTPRWPHFPQL